MIDLSDQPHLRGGGAMGALIRCHDWSTTPLGTLESWPLSLKTAVSLILRAQQPMFIGWGPRYISLYNDGYIPILGDKHPDALGHSMADVWSEIWDELRPLNEAVMRGESLSFENKPFQLAGARRPDRTISASPTRPCWMTTGRSRASSAWRSKPPRR
jgi:hypothetical protein